MRPRSKRPKRPTKQRAAPPAPLAPPADAALRESEERFRALVEYSSDAIALVDAQGVTTYTSRTATRLLGYAAEEFVGRGGFDLLHPDDVERARHLFEELLAQPGVPLRAELRVRHKDGTYRHLETVAVNRLDESAVGAIVVNYHDLTPRKRAERIQQATYRISQAALTAADLQALLRALHEIVNELMPAQNFYVALVDPERNWLTVPYFVDQYDREAPERPLGRGLTEYVMRTGRPLLATPDVYEDLVRRGEAELIGAPSLDWVGVPLQIRDRTIGVVAVQTYSEGIRYGEEEKDILTFVSTQVAMAIERKRADTALHQAEERYRAFITQSTEGIWRVEFDEPLPVDQPEAEQIEHFYRHSYLAECNDAMAQMYGYASAQELSGTRLGDLLVRSDPNNVEMLRAFLRSGYRLADVESHERDRVGQPKVFLNNLVGIVEDGLLKRAWGTQRDITDLKRLEDQLRQAQKMEAVGRLAGGVAHDFNNLLTAILGSVELLLRELEPASPLRQDAAEIKKAGERAAALTRQLLAYSRRQVLNPEVLDLNRVVADMDRMLRRLIGEDVDLVTRPAPDLDTVRADRGQIEQVLVNLVLNARDAMPQGGAYALLAVSDTGSGMDAETAAHLFEPFFTTKEVGKGTGLGLATVYGIVKQSGGYIWVESELDRGTTVRIAFPVVAASAPPREVPPARVEVTPAGETVLLVEDEEAVRRVAAKILTASGYRVLTAHDGPAALSAAARESGPIHLLLTDMVMPGMTGRELAERLVVVRPGTRVLYMSGYTEDAVVRETAAAHAFLQKPFEPETLARKVRDVLDGQPVPR